MHKAFPGYRKKTEAEIAAIWQEATFAFDTNVLLNVYRFKRDQQRQLLDILGRIKERCWLPHQVALEYHCQCDTIIGDQQSTYRRCKQALQQHYESAERLLQVFKNHPTINVDEIGHLLKEGYDTAKARLDEIQKQHPPRQEFDRARTRLDELFTGRVGSPFPPQRQAAVYAEAEWRFAYAIPPGTADARTKDDARQYGDVVLWLQLLDYAAEHHTPIILVTDDQKVDWWAGGTDKRTGPHPALVQEMHDRAGVAYLQYTSAQFLEQARTRLGISIEQDLIDVARDVGRQKGGLFSDFLAELQEGIRTPIDVGALSVLRDYLAMQPQIAQINQLAGLSQQATIQAAFGGMSKEYFSSIPQNLFPSIRADVFPTIRSDFVSSMPKRLASRKPHDEGSPGATGQDEPTDLGKDEE